MQSSTKKAQRRGTPASHGGQFLWVEGQVLLFRRHGEHVLGRVVSSRSAHLEVDVGEKAPLRISGQQVVAGTDARVLREEFIAWRGQCDGLVEEEQLREVWEVVQGDVSHLTLEQAAELVWEAPASDMQRAGLLLALHKSALYFAAQGEVWAPRSEAEVEERLDQREHRRTVEIERAAFLAWLSEGDEVASWSSRQEEWLEHLREYAVHGDAYDGSRTARNLLREVQPQSKDRQRLVFDLLVERGVYSLDEPLGLYRRGVAMEFPAAVVQEAAALPVSDGGQGRRDLTALPVFTVDEATTRDIDDGLSLERRDEGYLLGIHISDASPLVASGSALDMEAYRRMTSLYLPERTIPMLPRRLCEEMGSLSPEQPRMALSLLVSLGEDYRVVGWEAAPSTVRSRARLTYEEVDEALEGAESPHAATLRTLYDAARTLRQKRLDEGAVEFRRSELKVWVEADGGIGVKVEGPTPARRLVAEFMVLANRLLAEFCREHSIPAVFRHQPKVSLDDIPETNETVWTYLALRRMRPGEMSVEPKPHGTLGLQAYLQATSPLRRYPDMVLQRQVVHYLQHGAPLYDRETLASLLYPAEMRLRELARAEDERTRYWFLKHLRERAGAEMDGTVLDRRGHHALVELAAFPHRASVYLVHPMEPGETVRMRLEGVDLWRMEAHFVHVASA